MRIRSVLKHSAQALAEGSLIALLVVGLMAGSVFAAPGGGKGGGKGKPGGGSTTGSLTLVMVADANANGLPNWNDTITFTVNSTSTYPYVSVRCYQSGTLVYGADAGFYDSYPWPGARNMPLSSPSWTGGAADCNATLDGNPALNFYVGA
jgi:hypothetical protein